MNFLAYITDRTGICHRYALIAMERGDALQEAQLLGAALFGSGFVFNVRQA